MKTNGFGIMTAVSMDFLPPDIPVIEQGLPATLLYRAIKDLRSKGYLMREDVNAHINTARLAAIANLSFDDKFRCIQTTSETAELMLHGARPDDARDLVLAVAFFILKLIEMGLWGDAGNTAVIASIHIMEDAKEDPEWNYNEKWVGQAASAMLFIVTNKGLYKPIIA